MSKQFIEFQEIIDTMESAKYDYKLEYQWILNNLKNRKDGKTFTLQEHLGALVFALLSNQRPWKPIADNKAKIEKLFHNFDVDYLKKINPEYLSQEMLKLKCGNRQIKKQMESLKDNIATFEKITKDYGSVDNYYNSTDTLTLVKDLSSGKYKMKQMGIALISEYLKGVGVDIVKPDVHVCRLLGRLGYTEHNPAKEKEAFDVCHKIAQEYNVFDMEVDSILWQYCADSYFQQCTDKPNCRNCLVKKCKHRLLLK